LKALDDGFSDDDADLIIKIADTDGDGQINFQEFIALVTKPLVTAGKRFLTGHGSLAMTADA
jgi:hypothetical protein